MKIAYLYTQFKQLSKKEKKLFFEAYVTLGKMRMALLIRSFKHLTRTMEHTLHLKEELILNDTQSQTAEIVGRAVVRAAQYTPWESACLVQALSAQKMLQKRRVPGVFYLGVTQDKSISKKMKAHAWTQCGEMIITGEKGHKAFTVVSVFRWNMES